MEEKSFKNILVYDILYKTFFGSKPLRIRFDTQGGIIRVYGGARYLMIVWSWIIWYHVQQN